MAVVRGETQEEDAARCAAGQPLCAFLVVELFPKSGVAAIREQDMPGASRQDIVRDLVRCQWDRPHRIVLVDEAQGICRDVSAEIAEAVLAEAARNGEELHPVAADFCARHTSDSRSAAA